MNIEQLQSSEVCELGKALIKVQKALQPATKDRLNLFTKSNYATLNSVMESCKDALLGNNIWLCQYPVASELGTLGLVTKLTHVDSGQWQASLAIVPLAKNDPQSLGSAITYARRYSLSAMLGVVTEDDDDAQTAMPMSSSSELPKLDGVNFDERQDEHGQVMIVASGNTLAKKSILASMGFKWNPQDKHWSKYAA